MYLSIKVLKKLNNKENYLLIIVVMQIIKYIDLSGV